MQHCDKKNNEPDWNRVKQTQDHSPCHVLHNAYYIMKHLSPRIFQNEGPETFSDVAYHDSAMMRMQKVTKSC